MKNHKLKARLGLILITVLLISVSGCNYSNPSGPYTTSEIVGKLSKVRNPIPVYELKPESSYTDVVPIFYYYDDGSVTELRTFFISRRTGAQGTRIAKMRTSLKPPPLDDALNNAKRVTVLWDDKSTASTCDFTPGTFYPDSLTGDPYQTCLVWWSGDYTFLVYSVKSLAETLDLVNSLAQVK